MNANENPPIAVLFALARESAPFHRLLRARTSLADAPCPAWRARLADREIVVLETGIGADAAAAAVHWLLPERRPRPALVVAAGFAGALRADLRVGEVVLADAVCDPRGCEWVPTRPSFGDLGTRITASEPERQRGVFRVPGWRSGSDAERFGPVTCAQRLPHLATGRIVTLDRMVGDPAEKQRLGESHSAAAVDMETGTIARLCTEQGQPWTCVRAISDEMNQPLSPVLLRLLAGSRASPWRIGASLVCRPGLLPEMLRLERATRKAARQLAEVLASVLTRAGQQLPPCPPAAAGR